ncbi:hypothetical protein M501DRAFT_955621, partial [Patellaria atrata CBS 101060]
MTRFYPLYVRRSDGKLEIPAGSKGKKDKNQPTDDQLDRTPDAKGVSDYYREIGPDELKHLDWRRKLAGMLVRELGGAEHSDKCCILDALPENYRLYEHIKSKATDKENPSKAKNHAGGGHDRQDAYLYGHPLGRRKRFRSPADFFPHLLWLVTDEKGDPGNCSCKLCSPEEFEPEKGAGQPHITLRSPVVEIPRRPMSIQTPINTLSKSSGPPPPAHSPLPQPTPQRLIPTPLPQPRNSDQQIDAQYDKFMYRPGEIVWFNRGPRWGLSVISRRYWNKAAPQGDERIYIVQPLSPPGAYPAEVTVPQGHMLRPWLAWSAPALTCAALNEMNVTFETADWQRIAKGDFGFGDSEVDGSILAAKHIDSTYTLFDLVKRVSPNPGLDERWWNGLYLGSEKIWVGEPIRLRTGTNYPNVMVINEILERVQSDFSGAKSKSSVVLIGDIYTCFTVPVNQQLPEPSYLPLRMQKDLQWRNSVTIPTKQTAIFWKLSSSLSRIELSDIKGRWYETSLIFPILLDTKTFSENVRCGDINDAHFWINGRGGPDSDTSKPVGIRKADRREALSRAVPPSTRILDGLQPPAS